MKSRPMSDERKDALEDILRCWILLEDLEQDKLPDVRKTPVKKITPIKGGEQSGSGSDLGNSEEIVEVKHVFKFGGDDSDSNQELSDESEDASADDAPRTILEHAKKKIEESVDPGLVLPHFETTLYLGAIPRYVLNACVAEMDLPPDLRENFSRDEGNDVLPLRIVAAAAVSLDDNGAFCGFSLSPLLWGLKHHAEGGDGDLRKAYWMEMKDISKTIKEDFSDPLTHEDVKDIVKRFVIEENYFLKFNICEKINEYCNAWKRASGSGLEIKEESKWLLREIEKGSSEGLLFNCIVEITATMQPPDDDDRPDDFYTKLFKTSFFQKDLEALLRELQSPSFGKRGNGALSLVVNYMQGGFTECDELDRIDVMNGDKKRSLSVFQDVLSCRNLPLGRWPSRHSPVLMQQMAINLAAGRSIHCSKACEAERPQYLANDIVSVNGPPGTGKTTLLKDVVAANIVEKAKILAEVDGSPDDVFEIIGGAGKDVFGGRSSYRIKSEFDAINDYGIILCSANNKAVENISKELPDGEGFFEGFTDARREDLLEECFEEGKDLIAEDANTEDEDADESSREVFPELYFSKAASLQFSKDPRPADKAPDLLMAARLGKKDNIEDFCRALKSVIDAYDSASREEHVSKWKQASKEFLAQYEKTNAMLRKFGESLEGVGGTGVGPSFDWDGVGDSGSGRRWVDAQLIRDMRLHESAGDCEGDRRRVAHTFCPSPKPATSDKEDEGSLLSDARDNLFLLALRVTKEFVLASQCMKNNLKNLLEVWGRNDMPLNTLKRVMAPFFQTLNILTPIISSPFHSVGNESRMFGSVSICSEGKAPFGLLVVDEAGQAVPAYAVGALARCRRAMIVGDPSQIEPVVTGELDSVRARIVQMLPESSWEFFNKTASVQQFADRRNPIGTRMAALGGDPTWVGCPLVVHRRCASPMFDISNKLCYGGIMLNEMRPDESKNDSFCFPSSRWLNIPGREREVGKCHYVDSQGECAAKIVKKAFSKVGKGELPSLYVISPFKTVTESFKSYLESFLDTLSEEQLGNCSEKQIKEFCKNNIGTVHTFQGKEADEVIFMLGCDASSLGAVKWVNANIVNVAASRAKYRLYIIGDEAVWHVNPYVRMAFEIIVTAWADGCKHEGQEPDAQREGLKRALEGALDSLLDEEIAPFEDDDSESRGELLGSFALANVTDEKTGRQISEVLTRDVYRKYGFDGEDEFRKEFADTFHEFSDVFAKHEEDPDSVLESMLALLKVGMFLAELCGSDANLLAGTLREASGGSFSKAFEKYLHNIVRPLLLNVETVHGNMEKRVPTIGQYKDPLKKAKGEFAAFCRAAETDSDAEFVYTCEWWSSFANACHRVSKLRNYCSHGQEADEPYKDPLRCLLAWLLNPAEFVENDDDLDHYPRPDGVGLMRRGEAFCRVREGQLKLKESGSAADASNEESSPAVDDAAGASVAAAAVDTDDVTGVAEANCESVALCDAPEGKGCEEALVPIVDSSESDELMEDLLSLTKWMQTSSWKDELAWEKPIATQKINALLRDEKLLLQGTGGRRHDLSDELMELGARYVDGKEASGKQYQVLMYTKRAADRILEVVKERCAE